MFQNLVFLDLVCKLSQSSTFVVNLSLEAQIVLPLIIRYVCVHVQCYNGSQTFPLLENQSHSKVGIPNLPWLIGHAGTVTTKKRNNCNVPSLIHGEVLKSFTSYSQTSTFLFAPLIMDFSTECVVSQETFFTGVLMLGMQCKQHKQSLMFVLAYRNKR